MLTILAIIAVLWFVRTIKIVLFWLYLWQLKEYHIKRLFDHFKTAKGSEIVLDKIGITKIILLSLFFFNSFFVFWAIAFVYLLETGKTLLDLFRKKLLKPVFTIKITAIFVVVLFFESIAFVSSFLLNSYTPIIILLAADLLTPFVLSVIVMALQPFSWLFRKILLAKAARKIRKFKNLTVIGITGSYGKTSTKEFLAEMLSLKYKVLKTKSHINAEVGIANTILNELKDYHEILIAEVGAYEKGKIKEVCKMIRPKIGILTGINDQHLATFGSQENIIKGKFELIDSLPENGKAIFNWDSDLVRKEVIFRKPKIKYKRCSVQGVVDFFARDVQPYIDYLTLKLYDRTGESSQMQINLLGSQNAINIVLAAACAKELGMNLNEISRACFNIKPSQGGITYLKKISPIVIDASYSSNLDGVLADLEYLKLYPGKKVVIMPCLIELDGNSAKDHERIGEKITEACDMAIITSKECLGAIKVKFPKAVYMDNPEKIAAKAREFDVIFLEGRVPKQLINHLK
jgi:UDP-N-acetylmuramoyl-tripeptide--D-alanyl-D-alanine ligase